MDQHHIAQNGSHDQLETLAHYRIIELAQHLLDLDDTETLSTHEAIIAEDRERAAADGIEAMLLGRADYDQAYAAYENGQLDAAMPIAAVDESTLRELGPAEVIANSRSRGEP